MNTVHPWKKLLALFLSANLLATGLVQTAAAQVIGTQTAIESQQGNEQAGAVGSGKIDRFLARDEVRERLESLGVDPAVAQERIDSLTDREIAMLEQRIDKLPAGAGALEVIGIVFLILLILELVGVINIFHRV
jgi:hypothetical protein